MEKGLKVIGVKSITNTMSYNIYEIQHGIEDKVLAGYSNEKPRWRKLYSSNTKGLYFNSNGTRMYLDEFMRV